MKYFILLQLLFSGFVYGSDIDARLESFCKDSQVQTTRFQQARKNKGKYIHKKRRKNKTKKKNYRGCPMDLAWISKMKKTLCEGSSVKKFSESELNSISLPDTLLFYIAGASDFNAKAVTFTIAPNNLKGDEGSDLAGSNFSGKFLYALFRSYPEIKEKMNIFYYAGSGFKSRENGDSAKACIKDANSYLDLYTDLIDDKSIRPKMVLMGYSNGGALSVEIQEELGEENLSLDLVLAIDPIVQSVEFLFTSSSGFIGEKHQNTKRLVSLYQTKDYGSITPLHLKGRAVKNADINEKINCNKARALKCSGHRNHVQIMESKYVVDRVGSELSRLKYGE